MTKKLKKRLLKIVIGAVFFLGAVLFHEFYKGGNENLILGAFLIAYFIIGGDVIKKAVSNISHGQVFDENFLMLIATVGAFLVSEYPEAVAVMLFYQVGEWFQAFAVQRSRKSISDLMDIRPDYANVFRNGEVETVDPDEVEIGECIEVRAGEKVPLDGKIIEGTSALDTMALTGESVAREVAAGDEVISGCININGLLKIEVSKSFGESTVTRILDLVENASSKKAETENFITKFAKYYTPIVVILAVALAILGPVLTGQEFTSWLYRALTFLVVSCPCALVISIPLSFFGGIGGASKEGILIKGSNYLEALAKTEVVVMDKTGTLTKGIFGVEKIVPAENTEDEKQKEHMLELAAYAECHSNHPISKSLQDAYLKSTKQFDANRIGAVEEKAGFGVCAVIDKTEVLAGNAKLLEEHGMKVPNVEEIGTVVYVAQNKRYLGYILVADEIKSDSEKAIADMKKAGMKEIVMLTGDREDTANKVANKLGITKVFAGLLPADKVSRVEELLAQKSKDGKLLFVGDGINDAPVLARADIGVAMGGLGQDAAIEAADIVIMTDEPSKIGKAIKISKRTLSIVKQNIIFAIGIKVLVLILSAVGFANMWWAVFADVGVAFLAILNAMRALNTKGL